MPNKYETALRALIQCVVQENAKKFIALRFDESCFRFDFVSDAVVSWLMLPELCFQWPVKADLEGCQLACAAASECRF